MSHLTPTQSVKITPGGSGIPGSRHSWGTPVEGGDDWDSRVASYASALGLEPEAHAIFGERLDETVHSLALAANLDLDVARTKVVGALAGAHGMVTDTAPVTLDDDTLVEALLEWDIDDPDETDLVLARLTVMHRQLVRGEEPPTEEIPGQVEEFTGPPVEGEQVGGFLPLQGDEISVGQVAYAHDDVPANATDVAAWISDGISPDDQRARAQAAAEVEAARDGDPRKTVQAAIDAALSTGG